MTAKLNIYFKGHILGKWFLVLYLMQREGVVMFKSADKQTEEYDLNVNQTFDPRINPININIIIAKLS